MLASALAPHGVSLDTPELSRIQSFLDGIAQANERYSLVSRSALAELPRHVLDSLLIARGFPGGAGRLADVGSGNGFPGMIIALVRPDLEVHLIESSKKADFLEQAARSLDASNVRVHKERAEVVGRDRELRESMDLVVARAVGPLPVVLEYSLPLLEVGGTLVTPRGPKGEEEAREAAPAARTLGATAPRIDPYTLPGGGLFHMLSYRKEQPTPGRYPRRIGVPARTPLGSPGTS